MQNTCPGTASVKVEPHMAENVVTLADIINRAIVSVANALCQVNKALTISGVDGEGRGAITAQAISGGHYTDVQSSVAECHTGYGQSTDVAAVALSFRGGSNVRRWLKQHVQIAVVSERHRRVGSTHFVDVDALQPLQTIAVVVNTFLRTSHTQRIFNAKCRRPFSPFRRTAGQMSETV